MLNSLPELEQALRDYYRTYYQEQLGLPDWQERVEIRLDEENIHGKRAVEWVERWLNWSYTGKKVLVVGAGTGSDIFNLMTKGAEVTSLEPSAEALQIIEAKGRLRYDHPNKAIQAVGEHLPYPDNSFDLVYAFAVLEHSQNPTLCIDEMIRVVRSKRWIFIHTPNYHQLYDPHYKLSMPTFAPLWVLRLWLRLYRRPLAYVNTLQFVNGRYFRNTFRYRPVTALEVIPSWSKSFLQDRSRRARLIRWMAEWLGVENSQFWLLQKMNEPGLDGNG